MDFPVGWQVNWHKSHGMPDAVIRQYIFSASSPQKKAGGMLYSLHFSGGNLPRVPSVY